MAKIVKRKISWDNSTAPDVTAYRFYWTPSDTPVDYNAPHVEVSTPQVIIPDDVPSLVNIDETLNIGVTALDELGNESDMTVVNNVPFDFAAPPAPTNVVVETV